MITGFDHLVLTVRDPDAAAAFYARVLGMEEVTFAGGRRAVRFGDHKINLQNLGDERRNHACIGSGDLCLLTDLPPEAVAARLRETGVEPIEGPVGKSGARGPITSVYFTDPDGNLIEIASYAAD